MIIRIIAAFLIAIPTVLLRNLMEYISNQMAWFDIIEDYRTQERALYRELNELTDTYVGGSNNDKGWEIYQKAEAVAALRNRAIAAKRFNHSAEEWIAAKGGAA